MLLLLYLHLQLLLGLTAHGGMSAATYGTLHNILILTTVKFFRSWTHLLWLISRVSCNLLILIYLLMIYHLFAWLNVATYGTVIEIPSSSLLIVGYMILMDRCVARVFPILLVGWDLINLICLLLHLNAYFQIPPLKLNQLNYILFTQLNIKINFITSMHPNFSLNVKIIL